MRILILIKSFPFSLSQLHLIFQVDDEAMDLNKELMSKLLELDDVDAVYTDQK